jgi:cysteine desulfurase/selenocysteine lyase
MSISDSERPAVEVQPGQPDSSALRSAEFFSPAGLLDPLELTRMANEFFSSTPDSDAWPMRAVPTRSAGDLSAPSATLASFPAAPPEISLPSNPHFPGVPASVGPASVAPVTVPVQATPPAIPGVLGSAIPAQAPVSVPAFSFLQDARPIVSDRNTSPQSTYPQAKPITEFAFAEPALPDDQFVFERQALPQSVDFTQPPSPTMPSAFGFADSSAVPSFSFLEELRPLFSSPPSIPGPVPASSKTELPWKDAETTPLTKHPFDYDADLRPDNTSLFTFLEVRSLSAPDERSSLKPLESEPNVPGELSLSSYSFDAEALKRDFPILRERVNGRPLVWLDNAATTQKPQSVIDRLKYFYEHENSNVHRAAHELAARATDAYESAREKVRRFLNASSSREIIFVRGATEGINFVAQAWGRQNIQKDDEIVITWLEHHANIVPWQMLCSEKGARLRVAPVDSTGQVLLDEYEKLLGPRTRLVAFSQVSNALGVVTPAHAIIEAAHRHGAKVLLDGAQSVSHMRVDVQALDCDFFVFSGHKVFAPTGIGVVYGKPEILEHMPPWQGGGNMIQDVTFEKTIYQPAPQRFEAGTGNIADAVGLGSAIDYLDRVGMENITRHEHELLVYATEALQRIPGLRIIGTAKEKAGVLSFVMDGFRTEEIGDYLNRNGIAVRSGHHCAQPILRRFGLESTVRASLALYNTTEDIDALVLALTNLRLGRTSIA